MEARRLATMSRFEALRRRRWWVAAPFGVAAVVVAVVVGLAVAGSSTPARRVVTGPVSRTTAVGPAAPAGGGPVGGGTGGAGSGGAGSGGGRSGGGGLNAGGPNGAGTSAAGSSTGTPSSAAGAGSVATPPTTRLTSPGPATTVPASSEPGSSERSCGSQIVRSETTASTAYQKGQVIQIKLTVRNGGAACSGGSDYFCGADVSATGATGQDVWDSTAQPDQTGPAVTACPMDMIATLPAGWSQTETVTWHQNRCALDSSAPIATAPNPGCPDRQVPDGAYRLGGFASGPTVVIAG